jgi:hypothetical protein
MGSNEKRKEYRFLSRDIQREVRYVIRKSKVAL